MREIGQVFLSLPSKEKRKLYSHWVQGKAIAPTWFWKIIEEIMDDYTLEEVEAIYVFAQMVFFERTMEQAYQDLEAYCAYTVPFWYKNKND